LSQAIHSLSNMTPVFPLCLRPAMDGALQWTPSAERLTRSADSLSEKPSVAISQTPCSESYATDGSLARENVLRGCEETVKRGSRPFRQWRPVSFEAAKPMFRAPPLERRATWNVATTVEPHAKLSGSASVACIAPPPV
jgi:hypothetical protein